MLKLCDARNIGAVAYRKELVDLGPSVLLRPALGLLPQDHRDPHASNHGIHLGILCDLAAVRNGEEHGMAREPA